MNQREIKLRWKLYLPMEKTLINESIHFTTETQKHPGFNSHSQYNQMKKTSLFEISAKIRFIAIFNAVRRKKIRILKEIMNQHYNNDANVSFNEI